MSAVTMTNRTDSFLSNMISGIEDRQCDLIGRHRNLRDKVATMERSIPALMAYSMWTSERDSPDSPYCRVREIVNQLSPYPDPADKLVDELTSTVDHLRRETAELHDRIVDTDVKLEETDMELESVELANREMEERLTQLRSEVESARSLHSIRSEDLICLRKVRRLAEEELKLKNCIEHLENKECMYRRQMKKILSCKKHQCDNGQMRYAGKCDRDGKKPSYPPNDLVAEIMERYPLKDKGRNACSCAMAFNYEGTSRRLETCEESRSLQTCYVPLSARASRASAKKRYDCRYCEICQGMSASVLPIKSPCESLLHVASEIGLTRSIKQTQQTIPCDFNKTCKQCKIPDACKQTDDCVCKLSMSSYDCDVLQPSSPLNRMYQPPPASKSSRVAAEADDSTSDDEFCECCTCD